MVSVTCEEGPMQRKTLTFIYHKVFAQPVETCWLYKPTLKVVFSGQEHIFGIRLQLV